MRHKPEQPATSGVPATVAEEEPDQAPAARDVGISIDDLLAEQPQPQPEPVAQTPHIVTAASLRTARLLGISDRLATIALRGEKAPIASSLAPEVDSGLISDALESGDSVLVECIPGEAPVVVGVLLTRRPREIRLRAATVHIEGDEEVVLRSGQGAVRIRSDGDIEVVGSRISAASRGLFRIVGRLLRLN